MERIISGDARKKVGVVVAGAGAGAGATTVAAGGAGAGAADDGGLIASADAALLNFQRASCTLDATVRIWSCRVDDVWNSSHRVLENIARGGEAVATADAEGGGGGSGAAKPRARVGAAAAALTATAEGDSGSSSTTAWSPGIGLTLERDHDALLQTRVDAGIVVDPLFAKMSQDCGGGSEGGAAGLLLARLSVAGGCALAFDSGDAGDVDTSRGAELGAVGEAAMLPGDAGDELRAAWAKGLGVPYGDANRLAAALAHMFLAPSLDALYTALRTYGGVESPPTTTTIAPREAGSVWSTVAALSADTLTLLVSQPPNGSVPPTAPPSPMGSVGAGAAAAAATSAALAPLAALDAVELSRATALALIVDIEGGGVSDENDNAGSGGGGGGGGGDGGGWDHDEDYIAGAVAENDAQDTGDAGAATWGDVLRQLASPQPAPAIARRASLSALSALASDAFVAAADGDAALIVDLATLSIAAGPGPRTGAGTGAGSAWKFRTAAAGEKMTAPPRARARAANPSARRRTPGGPDYTVAGVVPPAETWATATRSNLSLTAPARAKMAAAAAAGVHDLPPHAALALFCARTRAPVDGKECLTQWMRLALRADVYCAPGPGSPRPLWPEAIGGETATRDNDDRDGDADGNGYGAPDHYDECDGWGASDGPAPGDVSALAFATPFETMVDTTIIAGGESVRVPSAAAASDSTTITPSGPVTLVAAVRHVEKIRVRYETTSKRVDVGALKRDFMGAIAGARSAGSLGAVTHVAQEAAARIGAEKRAASWMDVSGAGAGGQDSKTAAARAAAVDDLGATAKGSPLAFTKVIADLVPSNSQQVTVAYYFITLLHLANEHGLALTSSPGLSDLGIRDLL